MRTANSLIVNDELILSGMVLADSYAAWMWDEDIYFTPSMVREALGILGAGRVTVRLSSDGGHPSAGEAIRSMLAAHPGGCEIVVEGMAASAASLLYMAGADRVMTEGSLLMIHDPAAGEFGTEADHLKAAETLGLIANVYATVYANASGKSADECRAIMRVETWYGPAAAIAEGFADRVVSAPALMCAGAIAVANEDAAKAHVMAAAQKLRDRLSKAPAAMLATGGKTAAPGGAPTADAVHSEEAEMSGNNPAVDTTPATPPVAPVAPVMTADQILMAERGRVKAIRDMAAPFMASGRLVEADVTVLIDDGTSAQDAGQKLMAKMASSETPTNGRRAAIITRDETDTRMEGMIGALMRKTEGPAAQYAGMRLKSLAIELSGKARGYNDIETVRAGMMTTTMMGGALGVSDFAYITTAVMNRSLQDAYQRRAAVWQVVCGAPMTAPDFRELVSVRFGGDFQLKKVLENGEYEVANLQDEREGLKVERRGRTINLTFEAIVNDDMGAFARIPTEFALAARTMESAMVWSLIRGNAVLKSDNTALFHANHKNLAGAGGVISAATVGAGRKAMWEQTAFGSKDADDFLQISPDRMLVPAALEIAAGQFVAQTVPAKDSDTNPFKSSLTPIVVPNLGTAAGAAGSDTAWYLVSSDLPPVSHAFLEGYNAPTVVTTEGMNPDLVGMSARHFFAAAATEFRGIYKNPGV